MDRDRRKRKSDADGRGMEEMYTEREKEIRKKVEKKEDEGDTPAT